MDAFESDKTFEQAIRERAMAQREPPMIFLYSCETLPGSKPRSAINAWSNQMYLDNFPYPWSWNAQNGFVAGFDQSLSVKWTMTPELMGDLIVMNVDPSIESWEIYNHFNNNSPPLHNHFKRLIEVWSTGEFLSVAQDQANVAFLPVHKFNVKTKQEGDLSPGFFTIEFDDAPMCINGGDPFSRLYYVYFDEVARVHYDSQGWSKNVWYREIY